MDGQRSDRKSTRLNSSHGYISYAVFCLKKKKKQKKLIYILSLLLSFFFFNDTATTEIYTLSLHDALPISRWPTVSVCFATVMFCGEPRHFSERSRWRTAGSSTAVTSTIASTPDGWSEIRSEEHTSELQSRLHLVCRLLLEKKKKTKKTHLHSIPLTFFFFF